jgi:hypothetical protein
MRVKNINTLIFIIYKLNRLENSSLKIRENEISKKNIKKISYESSKEIIKSGLDVEFQDCGSTPNMSELIDSSNSLKLDNELKHKYMIKNLTKKYNFTTNDQVKSELEKYKTSKEKKKSNINEREMKIKKGNHLLKFSNLKFKKI